MNIQYFDLLPQDILFVILSNIEKDLKYPLLFVSKKLNIYVKSKKIFYNKKYFIDYIIKSGLFDLLKWTTENGYKCDSGTCAYAALNGHFDILKWAKENGCEWNSSTCSFAANKGHFEILKWAREKGCEWDCFTCTYAALNGHFEILKWARENGC